MDVGRTLNAAIVRLCGSTTAKAGRGLIEEDIHLQVRRRQPRRLVVFAIDTSDSMGEGPGARISAALGACLSLAATAYLNRDQVCLITFRDRAAELVVAPTSSIGRVRQHLHRLPIGGATPLSSGLEKARQVIWQAQLKDQHLVPLLVLISDGEATLAMHHGADPAEEALAVAGRMRKERVQALLIDTLGGHQPGRLMPKLARALGCACHNLQNLQAEQVLELIEQSGKSPSS